MQLSVRKIFPHKSSRPGNLYTKNVIKFFCFQLQGYGICYLDTFHRLHSWRILHYVMKCLSMAIFLRYCHPLFFDRVDEEELEILEVELVSNVHKNAIPEVCSNVGYRWNWDPGKGWYRAPYNANKRLETCWYDISCRYLFTIVISSTFAIFVYNFTSLDTLVFSVFVTEFYIGRNSINFLKALSFPTQFVLWWNWESCPF